MNQKECYLIKNTGILTVSNFSSKILVFLLVPLYTSVLTLDEYGMYDLAISTITFLYPILTVNIADGVMRFCMDKKYNSSTVAWIGWRYVRTSFWIAGGIAITFYGFKVYDAIAPYLLYTVFYYIAYVSNQFFIQLAKGLEHVTVMGIAGVVSTLVMISTNILFLLVFKWEIAGFYIANILSQAVSALYICYAVHFVKLMKGAEKEYRKTVGNEMVKYAFPLVFSTLAWWANSAVDKYVITLFLGVAANGIISIAYKIPQILNVIQSIFVQAWQISTIKEYMDKDSAKFFGKTFMVIMTIMEIACAFLIFMNRLLASFLWAKDFYVAWQYVPLLLMSCLLNTGSGLLGPILVAQKDSKSIAKSAIYGLVVNVIGNFVLIYYWGIQGGAIATAISSYVIYLVRKLACKDKIEIEEYWKVYVTWGLLVIQSIVEILAGPRIIQLVIIGIIVALKWNTLKYIVKKMLRKQSN